MSRRIGISEAQILDLAHFEESDAFSATEKLVLRLAVALTRTPASVDDQLFAALRNELDEAQIVELATAISWENHRARFNRTFAIGAEGFSKGAFCPLPETVPRSEQYQH